MKKTINNIWILLVIIAVALAGYFFFFGQNQNINNEGASEERAQTNGPENNNSKFRIIAVGDSLTAGYGLPLSDSYPKILEDKLISAGKDVEVINAGISGETTAGLLDRAQFIAEQNPDMLLITIGGNDAFRSLPIKNVKENIEKTIKIFKQSVDAEDIYLLQIESTANLGLSYRNNFNDIYEEIADSEKVNLLPFVVKEVFLDQTKMLPDSIHPNRDGYEFIVDKYIYPAVIKKVGK